MYGNERLSVTVKGVENGAGKLIENGDEIRLYYHQDLRGAVDYLTSPMSQKVESWTHYNEWGEITHNAVLKCGQRELDLVKNYTGHDYDQVLGLYYAKARMYDPADRRFISMDPVKGNVMEPMTMVQYLYCINNPLIFIDPLGLLYRIILEDDQGRIIKATTMYDDLYGSKDFFHVGELKHALMTSQGSYDYSWDSKTNQVKLKVMGAKKETKYEMYVDIDTLKKYDQLAASFTGGQSLESYKRSNNNKSPTVYFKFFDCWWAKGKDKTYVNAFQLGTLMGYNVRIIKMGTTSEDYVRRLLDVTTQTGDYIKKAFNQTVLGRYSNDITWLGTAGEAALSLSGLDIAADFRDIIYDLQHWDWEHAGTSFANLAVDSIGLLPLAGSLKHVDDVALILKRGDKTIALGKSGSILADSTLAFYHSITKSGGKYYAPKHIVNEIGRIEASGVDFSTLRKVVDKGRPSTEGGASHVIQYIDSQGKRFVVHEVTDAAGRLLHRDFDAVRIPSGQMINASKAK